MKKTFLLLLGLSVISCETNDDLDKLASKVKMIQSDDFKELYFYGANGYINKIEHKITGNEAKYVTEVLYNGYNITNVNQYENDQPYSQESYFYNNDLITKIEMSQFDVTKIKSFEYDSNNNIVREISTVNNQIVEIRTFTYNNGNISHIVTTNGLGEEFSITYEYDDKNNEMTGVLPDNFLKTKFISKNNIIKQNDVEKYYEYNKDNFPVMKIENSKKTIYTYY